MNYSGQAMFKEAAMMAAKGWKLIKLHGVKDDGTCTCGKQDCKTPGKHPAGGAGWQERATDDEETISGWFSEPDSDQTARHNVGVRLGKMSGIIDVEVDAPDSEAVILRFGLDKIDTPTYKASRGLHRIFQYTPDMPEAGVVKVEGLEVRIGGGDQATQSVVPCSWHKIGKQYEWLPGKSIDDVSPAVLPPEFMAALMGNSRKAGSGLVAQGLEALVSGDVFPEGERHPKLVGIASWLAGRIRIFNEREKSMLAKLLLCVNSTLCRPPKSREEILKIANDQFEWARQVWTEKRQGRPLEGLGLVWNGSEWEPGTWSLTVFHSSPTQYLLKIPYGDKPVVVPLSAGEWLAANAVAERILDYTKTMDVYAASRGRWKAIWSGETFEDEHGLRHSPGVKSKLMELSDHEYPGEDFQAVSRHAGILLGYLSKFTSQDEEAKPSPDGTPVWVKDGKEWKLHFKWREALARAWKEAGAGVCSQGDAGTLSRELMEAVHGPGVKEGLPYRTVAVDGVKGRWVAFGGKHMAALAKLSGVA
jgi:hypothetical protein